MIIGIFTHFFALETTLAERQFFCALAKLVGRCTNPYYTMHNAIQATPAHPQHASGSLEGQRYLERESKKSHGALFGLPVCIHAISCK
jgi:hypothetical protein